MLMASSEPSQVCEYPVQFACVSISSLTRSVWIPFLFIVGKVANRKEVAECIRVRAQTVRFGVDKDKMSDQRDRVEQWLNSKSGHFCHLNVSVHIHPSHF